MDSVPNWPKNFSLTVNSNSSFGKGLSADSRHENIHFTKGNLSEYDYIQLLDDMDFGVVGYAPVKGPNPFLMTNIELMGLSSGKLGFYTRSGLPMVLIGYPLPADLLLEYDFAISIDDESELAGALERLAKDYSRHASESEGFLTKC